MNRAGGVSLWGNSELQRDIEPPRSRQPHISTTPELLGHEEGVCGFCTCIYTKHSWGMVLPCQHWNTLSGPRWPSTDAALSLWSCITSYYTSVRGFLTSLHRGVAGDKHRPILWLSLCLEQRLQCVLVSAHTVYDYNNAKEVINLINSVCKQQHKDTVCFLPFFSLARSLPQLSVSVSLSITAPPLSLSRFNTGVFQSWWWASESARSVWSREKKTSAPSQ